MILVLLHFRASIDRSGGNAGSRGLRSRLKYPDGAVGDELIRESERGTVPSGRVLRGGVHGAPGQAVEWGLEQRPMAHRQVAAEGLSAFALG